ncbi:MAG: hypothetical protein UY76_C0009G0002 [Candidatus Uhrbacteria bacterium GW2011_GWA2_52_8d]|uniref:Restriction endonuclease n=1 Tax=Candidatus Uhrbacteria bacterium GW2011_GWA2_52_8d TaxID=1618979 RepID=A0A0G1XQB6_9BACT|nr:MAG: hypothetical protein UY76_C0009G0002 [Candidatus Uhrbacteria bacterium GW2011_GWA2_52_8d]
MIRYQFFPRSVGINEQVNKIIDCFKVVDEQICSPEHTLSSNEVLTILRKTLLSVPMQVEQGKAKGLKIPVPVLFGLNNKIDQHFDADALSSDGKIVLEVEAGRAVDNYQFLKDIFQACMMYGVEYLVLAVRNDYRKHDDFKKVYSFLETLYISNRLHLPLKGILLIGY